MSEEGNEAWRAFGANTEAGRTLRKLYGGPQSKPKVKRIMIFALFFYLLSSSLRLSDKLSLYDTCRLIIPNSGLMRVLHNVALLVQPFAYLLI